MISGFNDFIIIKDETKGDITITQNSQFNKIDADTVVIEENVTARLYGSIRNLLVLKKGARLILHGSIHGKVENLGGEIHFYEE